MTFFSSPKLDWFTGPIWTRPRVESFNGNFWFFSFSSTHTCLSMEDPLYLNFYEIRLCRLQPTCHIYAKYISYLSYFFCLFIILKYNFIKFGPFQLCVNFHFFILQCRRKLSTTVHGFEGVANNRQVDPGFERAWNVWCTHAVEPLPCCFYNCLS